MADLQPTPAQQAAATAGAQREHDRLLEVADERFGHATRIITGALTALDTTAHTATLARADSPTTVIADYGSLPVTSAHLGQQFLAVIDPSTRRAYLRIGLSA